MFNMLHEHIEHGFYFAPDEGGKFSAIADGFMELVCGDLSGLYCPLVEGEGAFIQSETHPDGTGFWIDIQKAGINEAVGGAVVGHTRTPFVCVPFNH